MLEAALQSCMRKFQFQKVRLKEDVIDIPAQDLMKFQFQKVRLKGQDIQEIVECTFKFQFQKVRLKGGKVTTNSCFVNVSIPKGSIKSLQQQERLSFAPCSFNSKRFD